MLHKLFMNTAIFVCIDALVDVSMIESMCNKSLDIYIKYVIHIIVKLSGYGPKFTDY